MSDHYDPLSWLMEWPHERIPVADAWDSVHVRFGFAAKEANEIETALVMIVSQSQQIKDMRLSFDDLLLYLEKNGSLTLGKLVEMFGKYFTLPEDLEEALAVAVRNRNYLAHHFFRQRAELFQTPDGCKKMEEELVSIQDDFTVALELLKSWHDNIFGSVPEDVVWDKINENYEKWKSDHDAMLMAILGKKGRFEQEK